MANNETLIPIPGRLHSVATEGHVAGADEIYDDTLGKDQATINSEVNTALGTGGTVDQKIAAALEDVAFIDDSESSPAVVPSFDPQADSLHKSAQVLSAAEKAQVKQNLGIDGDLSNLNNSILAEATARANAVSGVQNSVNAEATRAQAAEANRYTKSETYTKEEVHNLITTPNQEYVSVTATDQTTSVTDVLPATGAADTTYRVGNWDGTQYNDSVFSEYAWNGSAYIKLSTKSQIGEVYDISANHADTKYADLAAALGTNGANIPQNLRKGGMSVKYVQSSDNKYVQYRLMSLNWSTSVCDWVGVDTLLDRVLVQNMFSINEVLAGKYIGSNGAINEGTNTYRVVRLKLKTGKYLLICPSPSSSRTLFKYTDSTYSATGATEVIGQSGKQNKYITLEDGFYALSWWQPNGTSVVGNDEAFLINTVCLAIDNIYSAYSQIATTDAVANFNDSKKLDVRSDNNLLNKNDENVLVGYCMDMNGSISANSSYNVSGFVPVKPNKTYYAAEGKDFRFHTFFNERRAVVSGGSNSNTNSFTTTDETRFVRVTISDLEVAQISEQQSIYHNYNPIQGYLRYIPSLQSTFRRFYNNNNNLSGGSTLNVTSVKISKDFILSADIDGIIEDVSVGVGYMGFYGRWIKITQTQLIVCYGTSGTVVSTSNHGLTLGTSTKLVINRELGNAYITLFNDAGEYYKTEITWGVSVGVSFVMNNNTTDAISVEASFFAKDITQKVWMFGDSYFSYNDPARWVYYLLQDGFTTPLINARGGDNSADAINDLSKLLSLDTKPTYILWALGMNDGSDTTSVNSTWLTNIQTFIQACENIGATPILATIPSVPSKLHLYKNEWVRQSGYRYIDFAKAVEAEGTRTWKGWGTDKAMLSNDEVHPTAYGAKALYSAAITQFAEITVLP